MPELPEVETIARELQKILVGMCFRRVMLRRRDVVHGDPRPLRRLLLDRRVVGVARRGKRIVLELDPAARLIFHLGMTGRLTTVPREAAIEAHTHLRIGFEEGNRELRFRDPRRFGGVWFFGEDAAKNGRKLLELGPEPLELSPAGFQRVLGRKRRIKALLMDQQAIAGLGNIYCDESLHAAGIHPLTRADGLTPDQADGLLRAIKSTLRRAIRSKGSTLMDYRLPDGAEGSFQRLHRVYQREDLPCKSCGSRIVRILAAGRSTFFCPRCQQRQE